MKKSISYSPEEIKKANELWEKAEKAIEEGNVEEAIDYLEEGSKFKSPRKQEFKEHLNYIQQINKKEDFKNLSMLLRNPLRPFSSDDQYKEQTQNKKRINKRLSFENQSLITNTSEETDLFEDDLLEQKSFQPLCSLKKLHSFKYKKSKHPNEKIQNWILNTDTEGINILFQRLGEFEKNQGLWSEAYVFLFLLNYYMNKYGAEKVIPLSEFTLKEPLDNNQEIKTFNIAFSINSHKKPGKEVKIIWFNFDKNHDGKANRDIDVRKFKEKIPFKDYYIEVKSHLNKTDVHTFTKNEVALMLKVTGQQNQKYRIYQVNNVNKDEQKLSIHIKESPFKNEQDVCERAESIKLEFK